VEATGPRMAQGLFGEALFGCRWEKEEDICHGIEWNIMIYIYDGI
jgi:hypothetical protein